MGASLRNALTRAVVRRCLIRRADRRTVCQAEAIGLAPALRTDRVPCQIRAALLATVCSIAVIQPRIRLMR